MAATKTYNKLTYARQSKPDAEDNITCVAFPAWSSSETGVGEGSSRAGKERYI